MSLLLALLLLLPQSASSSATQPPAQLPARVPAPLQDEPISVPVIPYPPEAKKARIQGAVQLEVTVEPSGRVASVRALSGPIPLRQAAIDAYSRATYRPLMKDGRATPAIVTTTVNFALEELPPDPDQQLDVRFQNLHALCQQLSRNGDPDALAACRRAVDLSHQFSPQAQLEARASAVNDLVLILLTRKQYAEAASTADEAITLVAGADQPHTPAVATAYITRCEARSLAKDLSGAAADCTVAEETLSTLIADQRAPDESKLDRTANLKVQLRETLELHAIVLDKSHHAAEARRLRERAKQV